MESIDSEQELFHFFKIIEFAVTKAFWAISLVAIDTEVAVLVACDYIFASEAFTCCCFLILCDHASLVLIAAVSVFLNALHVNAETNTFFLSLMKNEFVGEVVQDLRRHLSQLFKVEVLDALMIRKFSPEILFIAYLAHYQNLRTVFLNVFIQLTSSHVLVLLSVANVTTEFRAVKLSMCLQFIKSFPHYFSSSIVSIAFMWKFTKVDTVLQYFIDFLHEFSAISTIWTTKIFTHRLDSISAWVSSSSHHFLVHSANKATDTFKATFLWVTKDCIILCEYFPELELAIFTEEFIAFPALKRLIWELEANNALDLFHHLSLELVLDFIHLDIQRRYRFRTHHSLHRSMCCL